MPDRVVEGGRGDAFERLSRRFRQQSNGDRASRRAMRWHKPATHKLVAAGDVYRLTGLSAKEILLQRDTQRLVRIDENGGRRDFIRIPVELLNGEAIDGNGPDG